MHLIPVWPAGQGQFATVFKGEHLKTKHVVAVKMIDRKDTGADVTQSATDKEIQIMKAVNHPNCVKLIEIYQTEDLVPTPEPYPAG